MVKNILVLNTKYDCDIYIRYNLLQPNFMVIFFAVLAFLSTFLGGLFGLRHKDKLHLILGFTAGVLLGVVAFDIFPEIIGLVHELKVEPVFPMIALVVGFLVFHILEKSLLIHHAQEESYGKHKHPIKIPTVEPYIFFCLMPRPPFSAHYRLNFLFYRVTL